MSLKPHGIESRGHFGGMMTVVVDNERAAARPLDLAQLLQAPIDPLEIGQGLLNGCVGNPEFGGHGDRRRHPPIAGDGRIA